MTSSDIDKSQIMYARLAGLMYLVVDAAYLTFALVTTRFRVPGDFAETAHRITGSELLYRIGLSSGLVASLCIVFLAMGLYVALKPLDNDLALLALVFRLLEATFVGAQAILGFVVLKLYISADSLNAFAGKQLSMFVTLHSTTDWLYLIASRYSLVSAPLSSFTFSSSRPISQNFCPVWAYWGPCWCR